MGMTRDKIEFAFQVGRQVPKASIWHIERLLRLAQSHMTLAVAHCNGTCACGGAEECPKEERIIKAIRKLCGEMDVAVRLQGDPRGWTVRLLINSTPDGFPRELGVPARG